MKKKAVTSWEPKGFQLEETTFWSFPRRGDWATHESGYTGNWTPHVPRNLILRYSHEGDTVLDPFLGGGTTLIECKLLKRHGIGIDVNERSIAYAKKHLDFHKNTTYNPKIYHGDSRKMDFIKTNSVDLVCGHPPYGNLIEYSKSIESDLSRYSEKPFLRAMEQVAKECHRVLKKGKYCCILMGDTTRGGNIVPISSRVMEGFIEAGFTLHSIVIKEQNNNKGTKNLMKICKEKGYLRVVHEYLYIFYKS